MDGTGKEKMVISRECIESDGEEVFVGVETENDLDSTDRTTEAGELENKVNFKAADGGDDDKEGGEAKMIDSVLHRGSYVSRREWS